VSFDLLPEESAATMLRAAQNPSLAPEPGVWGNFVPGAATLTMEGFAKAARGIDLMGAIGPIVEDRLTGGGTSETDKYFQEHDALYNRAVDYWTPAPGSVGTAGRVVGSLLPTLAQVAVSPALAINTAVMGAAEDLVREGIDASKAVKAGIVQGTGLGLGIYLPIFGNSFAMRALVAGAGSNVLQGIAARAASRKILEGTPAEKQFDPWDAESLVIDSLMGLGFGTMAHLGAKDAQTMQAVHDGMTETDRAAILTANQARHMEDTTAPGRPVTDLDRTLHAQAMRKAIDDVLNDRPAEVGQIVQDAHFAEDPARAAAQEELRAAVSTEAWKAVVDGIGREEGAPLWSRPAPSAFREGLADKIELANELLNAITLKNGTFGFLDDAATFLRRRYARNTEAGGGEGVPALSDDAMVERARALAEVHPDFLVPAEASSAQSERAALGLADAPTSFAHGDRSTAIPIAERFAQIDRENAAWKELEDRGVWREAALCFLGAI
jgi:hypothetical protein